VRTHEDRPVVPYPFQRPAGRARRLLGISEDGLLPSVRTRIEIVLKSVLRPAGRREHAQDELIFVEVLGELVAFGLSALARLAFDRLDEKVLAARQLPAAQPLQRLPANTTSRNACAPKGRTGFSTRAAPRVIS